MLMKLKTTAATSSRRHHSGSSTTPGEDVKAKPGRLDVLCMIHLIDRPTNRWNAKQPSNGPNLAALPCSPSICLPLPNQRRDQRLNPNCMTFTIVCEHAHME